MPTPNTSISSYRITRFYNLAESFAHQFVQRLQKMTKLSKKYEDKVNDNPYGNSPFYRVFSVLMAFAAFGLAAYAAMNAEIIFKAVIPSNVTDIKEGVNPVAMIIAVSLTIVGLGIGHLFDRTTIIERDQITGSPRLNSNLIKAIIAAIFYLGLQFMIARLAIGNEKEYNNFIFVNMGIAMLEIVVGALFLGQAMYLMSLWFMSLGMYRFQLQVNNAAKAANQNYNYYLDALKLYNNQNPENSIEQRGNKNIVKAIAYFTGLDDTELENQGSEEYNSNNDSPTEVRPDSVDHQVSRTQPMRQSENQESSENGSTERPMTEEELESFISENSIDDNLKF